MKEIKITYGMVGDELEKAQVHNARCEIVADIDRAMKDNFKHSGRVPLLRALTRLKAAAMKEDFGDYEGDLLDTVQAYSEQVNDIIDQYDNNYNV